MCSRVVNGRLLNLRQCTDHFPGWSVEIKWRCLVLCRKGTGGCTTSVTPSTDHRFTAVRWFVSTSSMSQSDVDDVCRLLKKLPLDDLHRLANLGMRVSPPLARLTRDQVIGKIGCALAKETDRSNRLEGVASIYCFLIDKMVLFPWSLYHLGAPGAEMSDLLRFHKRLLSAMQHPGSDNAEYNTLIGGAFRSVFCLTGPVPHVEGHDVVCLCAWDGWPYVAIYATTEACMVRVRNALEEVLPDEPRTLFQGVHFDLNSVFSALLRKTGGDGSASEIAMDQGLKDAQGTIPILRR
ncbi:hypothetical protein MTO96_041519 [Rhipicephalus appendiculatus]